MSILKMSSDEARSKWREVIDAAVAGKHVIIERYGKPVVAIVAHPEYLQSFGEANVVREATAVYQTDQWVSLKAELKAELITEIKAELLAEPGLREAVLQYELGQMHQSEEAHLDEEFADYEQSSAKEAVHIYSPRLVNPEQASDFKKEIIADT